MTTIKHKADMSLPAEVDTYSRRTPVTNTNMAALGTPGSEPLNPKVDQFKPPQAWFASDYKYYFGGGIL